MPTIHRSILFVLRSEFSWARGRISLDMASNPIKIDRSDPARYRRCTMESELAKYAARELMEAAKRMTQQQRLDAYIEHCRNVHRFYAAGRQVRDQVRRDSEPRK